MLHRNKKKKAGFSLIEIMVVITIIAVLGGIVGVSVMNSMASANIKAAIIQIRAFDSAIAEYKLRTKHYPRKDEGGLKALMKPVGMAQNPVMKAIPLDPWGNKYLYSPPEGSHKTPIVKTLGADGKVGGVGEEADIDSISINKVDEDSQ